MPGVRSCGRGGHLCHPRRRTRLVVVEERHPFLDAVGVAMHAARRVEEGDAPFRRRPLIVERRSSAPGHARTAARRDCNAQALSRILHSAARRAPDRRSR